MRRISHIPALTKKRFRRHLAIIGVLALWVAALSLMVLPLTRASAEKGFGFHTHQSNSASKGAGTSYSTAAGMAPFSSGGSEKEKRLRRICTGSAPRCASARHEHLDFSGSHGSGIPISSGGFVQGVGDSYHQQTGSDVSARDLSRDALRSGFSGFGLSAAGSGSDVFRAENPDAFEQSANFVASLNNNPEPNDRISSDPTKQEGANIGNPIFNGQPTILVAFDQVENKSAGPLETTSKVLIDLPGTAPPNVPISVPEPFTWLVFLAGLLGIFVSRIKREISGTTARFQDMVRGQQIIV